MYVELKRQISLSSTNKNTMTLSNTNEEKDFNLTTELKEPQGMTKDTLEKRFGSKFGRKHFDNDDWNGKIYDYEEGPAVFLNDDKKEIDEDLANELKEKKNFIMKAHTIIKMLETNELVDLSDYKEEMHSIELDDYKDILKEFDIRVKEIMREIEETNEFVVCVKIYSDDELVGAKIKDQMLSKEKFESEFDFSVELNWADREVNSFEDYIDANFERVTNNEEKTTKEEKQNIIKLK